MLPFRLDSRLVVNIGQPGPDPWFERLPRLDREDALRWKWDLPGSITILVYRP
jgi:hypothetical protein